MYYLVLFACVPLFLSVTAFADRSGRGFAAAPMPAGPVPPGSTVQANSAAVAAEMASRFGQKYGPLLRVPDSALYGTRKEEQPCLTPIDCVMDKRCAGHCGCQI